MLIKILNFFPLKHIKQQIKPTMTSIEKDHSRKEKAFYVPLMTFFLLHAQGAPQIMQSTCIANEGERGGRNHS